MQRVIVIQQQGSGEAKIKALSVRGRDLEIVEVIDIEGPLPPIIDEPEPYLPERLDADLVLSFVKHPDLVEELARLCRRQGTPMVASGSKVDVEGTLTPPT